MAALAGGCGQSDDRSAARAVTERFLAAIDAGEAGTACAALGDDTRAEFENSAGTPCEQAIRSLAIGGGEVVRVDVALVNARVDLTSGESVFLGETRDGWRLSAVGCRSAGGDPVSRPLDCELSA